MTTKQAEKNREQFPSKVLHYYNAPVDFDQEKINQVSFSYLIQTHYTLPSYLLLERFAQYPDVKVN